jgi:polyvinyl alcohol dehydrogenase (cytochrome)
VRTRGTHIAAAATLVATLAMPSGATADWPSYGHDLENTRNAGAAGPPARDVPALKRAWTFKAPTGDFTGTPVVAGGLVIAGNHGGWVYALDAVSGKVRWSKDLGAPVNGSAAIDGGAAYVPVAKPGGPRLAALSLADGGKRWDTTLTTQENSSVYGSPVAWRGTLYIGTSGPNNDDSRARGSVVALDEASGKVRWQTFTAPPGADGVAVFSTPAIDAATGRLYVGTGNNYHQPTTDMSDAIVAMDARTGRVLGHFQATANDAFSAADNPVGPDYDFGASPNLFAGPDGRRLVGDGQKSGVYWALDRETLDPVWNTRVGPGGPLGGILGTPAVGGDRIIGGDSLDGQVFGLGRDGSTAWQSAEAGGLHVTPATLANGVAYTVDPTGSVNARDPSTGAIIGKLPLDGPALGGVSAAGGALFVAQGTGPLPEPSPQTVNPGTIVAFGDTSTAGAPAPGAAGGRLRLTVKPRRVHANRRVRLRFRATRAGKPVRRVKIRIGLRRAFTKRNGRATVRLRFHILGAHFAHGPGTRTRIEVIR